MGLFASIALIVALPVFLGVFCGVVLGRGVGCPLTLVGLLAGSIVALPAHELAHYAAARLLGVSGTRIVFVARLLAIMLDYNYMKPRQYLLVALAPQALTPVLLWAAPLFPGLLGVVLCAMGAVNLASGAPDIVNALYFYLVHGDAEKFYLLYRWDGVVEGGVVEYKNKLVVYIMGSKTNKL